MLCSIDCEMRSDFPLFPAYLYTFAAAGGHTWSVGIKLVCCIRLDRTTSKPLVMQVKQLS